MLVSPHVTSGTVATIIRSATHFDISVGSRHAVSASVHVDRRYFCLFELGGETIHLADKATIAMWRDDAITRAWYQRTDGLRMVEALANHSRRICRVHRVDPGKILSSVGSAAMVLLVVTAMIEARTLFAALMAGLTGLTYRECSAQRSSSPKYRRSRPTALARRKPGPSEYKKGRARTPALFSVLSNSCCHEAGQRAGFSPPAPPWHQP